MDQWLLPTYSIKDEREEGFVLYISGPRGSGKSHMLVNLIANPEFYNGRFDKIYIFCPSFYSDPKYQLLDIPSSRVFETYKENKLKSIVQNKNKKEHVLIVLDDCITQDNFKSNKGENILNTIAVNGRHLGISMIMTAQKTSGGSTFVRSQADAVIIYKPRSLTEIDMLYQDNSVGTLSKKEFKQLVDYCTKEQYSFLYIRYKDHTTVWKNFNLITL